MNSFNVLTLASLALCSALASIGCSVETDSPDAKEQTSAVNAAGNEEAAPAPAPVPAPAPAPAPGPLCKPLAQPGGGVGLANPAATYCTEMGYQLVGSDCTFGDGTKCEEWAFFRGECGAAHSFCNLHGGSVSNVVENKGTWTASYALCTMPNGTSCEEQSFASTCSCE